MSEFEIVGEPAAVAHRRELAATVGRFAQFCREHPGQWVRYPGLHSDYETEIIATLLSLEGVTTERSYVGDEQHKVVGTVIL